MIEFRCKRRLYEHYSDYTGVWCNRVFHEFGHFIVAKMNKIAVMEFSIGMGPAIFSIQKKETKYSLRLLPIGGYCMMMGEDGESEDENAFNNKPLLARILVIAAGPVFNFILAFVFQLY